MRTLSPTETRAWLDHGAVMHKWEIRLDFSVPVANGHQNKAMTTLSSLAMRPRHQLLALHWQLCPKVQRLRPLLKLKPKTASLNYRLATALTCSGWCVTAQLMAQSFPASYAALECQRGRKPAGLCMALRK